jgi:hypothetical protein
VAGVTLMGCILDRRPPGKRAVAPVFRSQTVFVADLGG